MIDKKEKYFNVLRKKNLRITKPRKALIEILEDNHLTFKEIQKKLAERGFTNVSTIYNNLDFLIQEKIAVELYINETKYYDLAIDNKMHNADSHIHVLIKDNNEILEVSCADIFDYIEDHEAFDNFDVKYIRITVGARKKQV
ncbi:MAG: transcriptional repressor [Acholeplasmataceae bacterium]|jgi:Fur family ferric uptake transcriptional regulator/Fur family peroxide stress response transcriptional regulator|nr:transcriptional repressor [Acholeplasmataceae bacterium]